MGTDYEARKMAKSQRRRSSEQPKRVRKKNNQPRRLCRGPCFSPPTLEVDQSDEDAAPSTRRLSAGGELSKYSNLTFGGGGKKEDAKAAKKRKEKGTPAATNEEDEAHKKKKTKLSTQVQLLASTSIPDADNDGEEENVPATTRKNNRKKAPPSDSLDPYLASLPEQIQYFFSGEGLESPMPVQKQCWPYLLAGRDVEVVAEPGSGKTIAFLLPAAVKLAQMGHKGNTSPEAPLVLILAPTRELTQQVASVAQRIKRHCGGLRTVCFTGGTEKAPQIQALRKNPHIVVATPGRLLDLIDDGHCSLDAVQYVVLDEADKMLGVGFAPQIDRIKSLLGLDTSKTTSAKTNSKNRNASERAAVQVGLFTATMPAAMHALTSTWLHKPKKIALKSASSGASAGRAISATVVQVVQVCAEHKKPAKLMKHLESIKAAAASAGNRHAPKILIFSNRIKTVRFIFKLVLKANFRTAQLHGERSQEEREEAIKDFKSGKVQVLVASDVAARGLDVQNLPYVVNYDFPGNLETYIHRVGRTGRLAADGHAFSFLTREMAPLAGSLLGLLREHDQSVDPNLVKLAQAYEVAAKKLGLPLTGGKGGCEAVENGGSKEKEEKEERADIDGDFSRLKPNRPATEDILRELDMKTKAQKRRDKLIEAKQEKKRKNRELAAEAAGKEFSEEEEEEESSSSDDDIISDSDVFEGDDNSSKKKGGKKFSAAAIPEFLPFKKFSGARPGYVFKKGGMGVGYYIDHPPHKVLKDLARARKQIAAKYAAKPVGGGATEKLKKKAGAVATKAVPLLPGKMKTLERQQQEYPSSDEEGFGGSSSDSDSEGGGGNRGGLKKAHGLNSTSPSPPPPVVVAVELSGQKKRGALPGRLRKKLAKDRMKKAAAAANGGGGRVGVKKSR